MKIKRPLSKARLQATHDAAEDTAGEYSLENGEPLPLVDLCPWILYRSDDAGVIVGQQVSFNAATRSAVVFNSHKIWSWFGAEEVGELAAYGCSEKSWVTKRVVGQRVVLDICEAIQVSEQALKSLTEPKWSK
jgi:hypothetical protein